MDVSLVTEKRIKSRLGVVFFCWLVVIITFRYTMRSFIISWNISSKNTFPTFRGKTVYGVYQSEIQDYVCMANKPQSASLPSYVVHQIQFFTCTMLL